MYEKRFQGNVPDRSIVVRNGLKYVGVHSFGAETTIVTLSPDEAEKMGLDLIQRAMEIRASRAAVLSDRLRAKAFNEALNAIGGLLSPGPVGVRERAICDAQDAVIPLREKALRGAVESSGEVPNE